MTNYTRKKKWVSFATFIKNFLNVFFFYLVEELFPLELLFFMPCNAYQEKKNVGVASESVIKQIPLILNFYLAILPID